MHFQITIALNLLLELSIAGRVSYRARRSAPGHFQALSPPVRTFYRLCGAKQVTQLTIHQLRRHALRPAGGRYAAYLLQQ